MGEDRVGGRLEPVDEDPDEDEELKPNKETAKRASRENERHAEESQPKLDLEDGPGPKMDGDLAHGVADEIDEEVLPDEIDEEVVRGKTDGSMTKEGKRNYNEDYWKQPEVADG